MSHYNLGSNKMGAPGANSEHMKIIFNNLNVLRGGLLGVSMCLAGKSW